MTIREVNLDNFSTFLYRNQLVISAVILVSTLFLLFAISYYAFIYLFLAYFAHHGRVDQFTNNANE